MLRASIDFLLLPERRILTRSFALGKPCRCVDYRLALELFSSSSFLQASRQALPIRSQRMRRSDASERPLIGGKDPPELHKPATAIRGCWAPSRNSHNAICHFVAER